SKATDLRERLRFGREIREIVDRDGPVTGPDREDDLGRARRDGDDPLDWSREGDLLAAVVGDDEREVGRGGRSRCGDGRGQTTAGDQREEENREDREERPNAHLAHPFL